MANIDIDLTGGSTVPTANKTNNWLESMFVGLTGTFNALSGFIAGEAGAEAADFRGRQAGSQIAQIERDVSTGVQRIGKAGAEKAGQQRTAIAKSGVALSGSAEAAITETDRQTALDTLALKHRGALATIEKQAEADFARIEARGERALGRIGAASSLLEGASEVRRIRLGV